MMNVDPIHQISTEDLDRILANARKFIEWDIEPKHYHLQRMIDSIKESLIHFLPDDEDLIKGINDVKGATIIIDTFPGGVSHPLKEGLITLREIFHIIDSQRDSCNLLELRWAINDYITSIEPYVLREKLDKFHLMQSDRAKKARTRNGLSPEARQERDKKILADYDKSKSRLSLESFAKHHEKKRSYKKGNGEYLKQSAIKKIIKANHTNDT